MIRLTIRDFLSLCAVFVLLVVLAPSSYSIVRRNDVADSQYTGASASTDNIVWIRGTTGLYSTGTLIAPNWILTSGALITTGNLGQLQIGYGPVIERSNPTKLLGPVLSAATIYDGDITSGSDIKLLRLDVPARTNDGQPITSRPRNSEAPSGLIGDAVTFIGYGQSGVGTTGPTISADTKRAATNTIDGQGNLLNSAFGGTWSNNFLVADFDGPSGPNRFGSSSLTVREGGLALGDGGGPWLVNGALAGVSSFAGGYITGDRSYGYGAAEAAVAVAPHRAWINSTMGGVNWLNRGTSGFRTQANWGDGVVPLSTEPVRFSLLDISGQSAPVITHSSNNTVSRLAVEFGRHDFDMNNPAGNDWTFASTGLATVRDEGLMFIRNGTLYAAGRMDVSYGGRVNISTGGRLRADAPAGSFDALYVGDYEQGVLTQPTGLLEVHGNTYLGIRAGTSGQYIFSGGDATFNGNVYVGSAGYADWQQSGGADAAITGDFIIGNQASGEGFYIKSGGTLTVGDQVFVGLSGEGHITHSAGSLNANTLQLGQNIGSQGVVNAIGDSLTTISQTAIIGNLGSGTVHVRESARLHTDAISLGRGTAALGSLYLHGGQTKTTLNLNIGDAANSTLSSGIQVLAGELDVGTDLRVGAIGAGVLQQAGGVVRVTGSVIVGDAATAVGLIEITGGQLVVNESIRLSRNGAGQMNQSGEALVTITEELNLGTSGAYHLSGGKLYVGGSMRVNAVEISNFSFTGGTLDVKSFSGNLDNQGGVLAVRGNNGARTIIAGDYSQSSTSAIEFEVGSSSHQDSMDVLGDVSLAGQLRLQLPWGAIADPNYLHTLLAADGALFGQFANVAPGGRLNTVDQLGSFQVDYGPTSPFDPTAVVLSNWAPRAIGLPGDYNDDGAVDAADYTLWRDNLGTNSPLPNRNPGFNGPIFAGDYDFWRANFGQTATAIAINSATVPEPQAAMVALLVLLCGRFAIDSSRRF